MSSSDPDLALAHHDLRRRSGRSTVSVLIGPMSGRFYWERWAKSRGRETLRLEPAGPEVLAAQWLEFVAHQYQLPHVAIRLLAQRLGRDHGELWASIREIPRGQLELLLERGLVDESPELAVVCRELTCLHGQRHADSDLAHRIVQAFAGRERPWLVALMTMHNLILPTAAPAVLLTPPPTDRIAQIQLAAQFLCEVAESLPILPVALTVTAHDFGQYLQATPETRAKASLREGIVFTETREPPEATSTTMRLAVEKSPKATNAAIPCSTHAAGADRAALQALDDAARSAAERFLFDRLEALPDTVGLFELNGSLSLASKTGCRAEVDLLARRIQLAIEIDGYYHFQNPDAYRRDRRKDVALQESGYLVLRFLADDIVGRLESILATIQGAVASRRRLARPEEKSP